VARHLRLERHGTDESILLGRLLQHAELCHLLLLQLLLLELLLLLLHKRGLTAAGGAAGPPKIVG
jgi:hypothetical protein